jgi:uncharacterized protein Yka (UPF0111/DUF47 family)
LSNEAVTGKSAIVEALGERKLALPRLINDALAANDRIKYRFALLQAGRHHADHPGDPVQTLHAERLQAGIDDAQLDRFVGETGSVSPGYYRMPGARGLLEGAAADLKAMLAPVAAAEAGPPSGKCMEFEQRLDTLLPRAAAEPDDRLAGETIDAITHGLRERGDSVHLLVMDLHRALNQLQRAVASEVIDGASAYDLADGDRALVRAFMQGVNRTSRLRFDHPGLGATATRSGNRLVIQNDIGTTDAHVLVVHVEGLACTITYTDIHLQRLLFFQSLFDERGVEWEDTRSVRNREMESGLYHVGLGHFRAADGGDLESFLALAGSRLVFLIDWNKARKRLRSLLGRRDTLRLLHWAADQDVGHMGFLRLGGDRAVFDALEFAARGQAHFGRRLDELLGTERAVAFLRYVFRRATEGLLGGEPDALIIDEVRAELMRHYRGSGRGLHEVVVDHASLIVELAAGVRDALLDLRGSDGPERVRAFAARAKAWESDADRLLNEARAVSLPSPETDFLKLTIERADDVADDLEEAAFLTTLIATTGLEGELLDGLTKLASLVVQSSQELLKSLLGLEAAQPGAAREDTQEFLASIHRIAVLEHETDTVRRHVSTLLVSSSPDARQMMVTSDCARKLEAAADHLLHVGLGLRDYMLRSVAR